MRSGAIEGAISSMVLRIDKSSLSSISRASDVQRGPLKKLEEPKVAFIWVTCSGAANGDYPLWYTGGAAVIFASSYPALCFQNLPSFYVLVKSTALYKSFLNSVAFFECCIKIWDALSSTEVPLFVFAAIWKVMGCSSRFGVRLAGRLLTLCSPPVWLSKKD